MLRYALRRILWAIPTLVGISLIVFFLTTLIPDPVRRAAPTTPSTPSTGQARDPADVHLEEARRARFLDLPRFFNANPLDVSARAEECVVHIAADDAERADSARRLTELGGAALPHVLPALESLPPEARGRVALALTPLAERMGIAANEDLSRADLAATFWTRFWEDRSLDFTHPAVQRAVTRLVEHGTDLRERDLRVVDTFALPEIMQAIADGPDRVALARLTRLAAHATGRGHELPEAAGSTLMRRILADWREYWYVHRTEFVVLDGAERVSATVGETRYGKWIMRAATGHLGISIRDGEPIADKLMDRAPITLLITTLAMFLSYALAIPIGVLTAWRKRGRIDFTFAFGLFVLYSLPTFWTAELLRRAFESGLANESNTGADRLILPVIALALGSLATLSRYQRIAMLDVIRQDYIRTARAKGVSTLRWLLVHALRNALLPTVTLAGLQLPALLGGAFVVEEVFAVPGLGYETLRAVESHDAAWLMATVVLAAVVTTVGLIASDVAYGVLDPRVREALTGQRARA
jgi:peptide/nickel transport system permease protein